MTLNEYQDQAIQTAVEMDEFEGIIYRSLGLSGEAGEVAEKIKKIIRDKNKIISNNDKLEIAKELGDVLWYTQALSVSLGYNLEEIAQLNLAKLQSRKSRNKIKGSGDNR